jgi:hypothetical protein
MIKKRMPVTNGGADWRTRALTVEPTSSALPRFQAMSIPRQAPNTSVKLMAAPIRKMVFQKRYLRMLNTSCWVV